MIFIWLLLANLLYTGIRDALHVLDRFDAPLGEAIGNLTVFFIMGLVACIPGIIESVRLYPKKELNQQRAWLIMKTWIQLVCISLCYFIGDNLYQTLSVHGEPIGCGDRCLTTSRIASLACLGIAAVSVYLTPSLFKEIESAAKFEEKKEEESERNSDLLHILLKLFVEGVKVDIMYTTLLGFGMSYGFDFDTKKMQYCENGSKAYGLLIIVSCYLIAIVIAFIQYRSTLIKCQACNHEKRKKWRKIVSDICTWDRMLAICCCLFFLFFLVMFTLADNPLPLEYELCNYNSSSPEYRLTKQRIFQVKSALSFICFLLVLVPVFALFCINFINSLSYALITHV